MNVEQFVEWELAKTEVLEENLVPLCPPRIPHDLIWDVNRKAVV
jgi:hypothetical protein